MEREKFNYKSKINYDDFIQYAKLNKNIKYGNFVNRTLKFKGINKIPVASMNKDIEDAIILAYEEIGNAIEKLEFKEASSNVLP